MNVGYLLVSLASLTTAIRVDWNTNQGPIVPPIPTVQPVPQPPFRSPAPVWEDQSNDIPNPNPYQYVLPPPSRPKYPDNNYLTAPLYPNRQTAYQVVPIPATAINSLYYNYKNNIVPSLGIQYIPNIGNRYTYVIPSSGTATASTTTTTTTSASKSGNYIKPDKLNGKYNPKLKKYKANRDSNYSRIFFKAIWLYISKTVLMELPTLPWERHDT
uniref:DUF4794 domain-containing protein n=1 Tax=Megaselia scalaris TaxID=36166 RepID=T1GPL6_MEGSC